MTTGIAPARILAAEDSQVRKTIVKFGLMSGAISTAMMLVTIPFIDRIGDKGELVGYTAIVVSFLFVFFGIRSYRDNVAGGTITFGRAFSVGILITVISCLCYVATWEILYFKMHFMAGFMDQYVAVSIDRLKASGASPETVQAEVVRMNNFKRLYQNPLFNAAITFVEPFPVGLIMTVMSAAILRKKPTPGVPAGAVVS